ncbi:putative peptidoglycan lipid II flippase [Pedococcus dokdonensis]|uniref:Putative peptidoglycan lipid II flippase n=1 Tax=Pedococcus dokdonensis TaxID=443156 RepID=A0A1H0PN06_9MICO|nr:lipid II flippase MurJ [Pedococcus dokdonensis]SDP06471.1 putative peptidoglycan lipid II flippase [Pedococcus dokdonensis]
MTARTVGTSVARAALVIAVATLLARLAGFARTLVFSHSVGAGGVGDTYQTVNTLPNVVYEVAAGGALAAVAVPLIAGQLGAGRREDADRTASALLTWAVAVLVPLSVVLAVAAPWVSEVLLRKSKVPGAADLGTTMLMVFAPQVALYGVGVVLAGVLQAHRRFLAAALAPLLSSLVVIAAYVAYRFVAAPDATPADVSSGATWVLAGGTTLGVVVLSLPLLVPALRAGVRLRPTFSFPDGVARRAAALAGAGVLALVAQQAAVAATLWLTHEPRTVDTGVVNVYAYVQAVYLLPYAVLAVPIATSAFPALAHSTVAEELQQHVGTSARETLASALRGILLLTAGAVTVLMAVAQPVGIFFQSLDRASDTGGGAALAALPGALSAYAPGLVGFSVAALLTRALYVRGRPIHAALAVAAGWSLAALLPLALVPAGSSAGTTLGLLGIGSTVGMTVSAGVLVLLVRSAWGPEATQGAGRTLGAAIVSVAVGLAVGDTVARSLTPDSLWSALGTGLAVGLVTLLVYLGVMMVADRKAMTALRERGRSRRRGTSA